MTEKASDHSLMPRRKIHIFGRTIHLPHSKPLRIAIGVLLIFFGIFGFLPVLGFWMVPLGLLVLSVDIPRVRRWRRRFAVWFSRRYPGLAARLHVRSNGNGGSAG
jgi:hypothetical protein